MGQDEMTGGRNSGSCNGYAVRGSLAPVTLEEKHEKKVFASWQRPFVEGVPRDSFSESDSIRLKILGAVPIRVTVRSRRGLEPENFSSPRALLEIVFLRNPSGSAMIPASLAMIPASLAMIPASLGLGAFSLGWSDE